MKFLCLTKVKLKRKFGFILIMMCAVYVIIYHNYNDVIYFSVKIGREIVCKTYERSPSNTDNMSTSPPVILETTFGLGNQMFQYAASYAIARRRNSDLYICLKKRDVSRNYQNVTILTKPNPFDRSYGLGRFKIPHDKLLIKPTGSRMACESLLKGSKNYLTFTANEETMVKCQIPSDRVVKINGYFESEIFFHEYREELLNMFVPDNVEAMEKQTKEILKRIEETESICVHVRRRDFNNNERRLPDSYYMEAMTLMEKKLLAKNLVFNRTFFVFSDDISSVAENFNETINIDKKHYVVFVSNENFSRYHDLFLMTKCKHLIMANSTFSWWAAYLNRHKDKIVIAPLPKFKDTYTYWNHPYNQLVKNLQYYWAYPNSYLIIKPKFI